MMPAPFKEKPEWELLELRARIRMIDTELIVLLSRRFEVVRAIQALKQQAGMPSFEVARERDVLTHCVELATSLQVPLDVVHELYRLCFAHARGPVDPAAQNPPAT